MFIGLFTEIKVIRMDIGLSRNTAGINKPVLKTKHIPLESFKLKTYLFTKAYDHWSSWNLSKFLLSTCLTLLDLY